MTSPYIINVCCSQTAENRAGNTVIWHITKQILNNGCTRLKKLAGTNKT